MVGKYHLIKIGFLKDIKFIWWQIWAALRRLPSRRWLECYFCVRQWEKRSGIDRDGIEDEQELAVGETDASLSENRRNFRDIDASLVEIIVPFSQPLSSTAVFRRTNMSARRASCATLTLKRVISRKTIWKLGTWKHDQRRSIFHLKQKCCTPLPLFVLSIAQWNQVALSGLHTVCLCSATVKNKTVAILFIW